MCAHTHTHTVILKLIWNAKDYVKRLWKKKRTKLEALHYLILRLTIKDSHKDSVALASRETMETYPWCSSGWDSVLPLQGACVLSLVRELKSHMLYRAAKGGRKDRKWNRDQRNKTAQKETHSSILNWFLTKIQRCRKNRFSAERIVFNKWFWQD